MIKTKRVYEEASPQDGARFLVERLWPRGLTKEELRMDAWLKEVGPSTDLREWYHHDPTKWDEFVQRYYAELDGKAATWQPLADAAQKGDVTLLYSARDTEHNSAVALQRYLEQHLAR